MAESIGEMGVELFVDGSSGNNSGNGAGDIEDAQLSSSEEVLAVLNQAFKDTVASVREKAALSIPALLQCTHNSPANRQKLLAFLSVFAEDSSYRNRMVCANSILASVSSAGLLSKETFENYFLGMINKLAVDKVVNVRICVARVVRALCSDPLLYGDSLSRLPIQDLISSLVHSGDRDVLALVEEFYVNGTTPMTSPFTLQATTTAMGDSRNRSDSNSSMMNFESLPTTRTNPTRHGINDDDDDDDEEDQDHVMSDVQNQQHQHQHEHQQQQIFGLDEIDEDASMDLADDSEPVLLERPMNRDDDQCWTIRETQDSDFVEVTQN